MTQFKITPMEAALLQSLSESQKEHERRLAVLEELLTQLSTRSTKDSESAQKGFAEFGEFVAQLDQLNIKLTSLDDRLTGLHAQLTKWTPIWSTLDSRLKMFQADSQAKSQAYKQATEAFNYMKAQYNNLASEMTQLRRLAGG